MGLRFLRLLLLLLCVILPIATTAVVAAEVTLRMRGGTFEIKGELKSFNLKTWVIDAQNLGTLSLDAGRYECVAGECPLDRVEQAVRPRAPGENVTTTWVGGSAIGTEFMPRLIRAYAASIGANVEMKVQSDTKNLAFELTKSDDGRRIGQVNVHRQGVPQGFVALAKGEADLVWSSRPILPEEEQMMAASGTSNMRQPGYQHIWALDALIVVVSKRNPVVSLSLQSIARIFAGEIKDWGELGLPAGRIKVYAPTAEMGTWSYFEGAVLTTRGLKISPGAVRLEHATEWTDRVAEDPLGIGVNTIAYTRKAKAVNIETECGIVVPPSTFVAKTEEYPLARPLYFYTKGRPSNPLAAELLNFALSPMVQGVLRDARFVDQTPELAPFLAHTGRIAIALNAPAEDFDPALMGRLVDDIRSGQRLSLTVRFPGGGFALDSRAMRDIGRLGPLLQSAEMRGKTLMLVGFADSVGRFDGNLQISRRRMQVVRSALLRAVPELDKTITVVERGYGELAPVACNDTDQGRALNRRVEFWVR